MLDWYTFISQFSGWIGEWFGVASYQTTFPLLAALLLGITGALAPCQLSANLAAITYFGQRSIRKEVDVEVYLYIAGKVVVYTLLGALIYLFGEAVSQNSIPIFVWAKKLSGPLFLLAGLYMLGLWTTRFSLFSSFSQKLEQLSRRLGRKKGAFILGIALSLGFCPTMAWLFFGLLTPLVFGSSYGMVFPAVFGIGTAFPLLVFVLLIPMSSDKGKGIRTSMHFGRRVQRIAGIIFILIGANDIALYWLSS